MSHEFIVWEISIKARLSDQLQNVCTHLELIALYYCSPGSVVLFMINLDHSEVVFSLEDPQLKKSSRDIYWLTSTELPELTSKYVSLRS